MLGLVRGDIVPGFIYRAEVAQRQKAEAQADKNSDALTELAKAATKTADTRRRDERRRAPGKADA